MMMNLRHGIEYLAVVFFLGSIKIFPRFILSLLARFLGKLGYLFTPGRVKIANKNLMRIFPEMNSSNRNNIIKNVYINLVKVYIDFVSDGSKEPDITYDPQAKEKLKEISERIKQGKSVIIASGHFGNWELVVKMMAIHFADNAYYLAKQQHNPYVNNLINLLRTRWGGEIIPSQSAPRLLPKLFRKGGGFLFASDQEGGKDGVIVEFLGQPTSYARGMALYSFHYNVPIALTFVKREADGYRVYLPEIIEPNLNANKKDEIKRIIERYSEILGEFVSEDPAQWLWTHRRWKSFDRSLSA